MMLKPVLKPVFVGFETDQHAGRSAVSGDHDLPIRSQS